MTHDEQNAFENGRAVFAVAVRRGWNAVTAADKWGYAPGSGPEWFAFLDGFHTERLAAKKGTKS